MGIIAATEKNFAEQTLLYYSPVLHLYVFIHVLPAFVPGAPYTLPAVYGIYEDEQTNIVLLFFSRDLNKNVGG